MAEEDLKFTFRFAFTIFLAAFGSSFQYGYNVGVVNAPQKAIESWMDKILLKQEPNFNEDQRQQRVTILYSLMVSFICLGGLCGALLVDFFVLIFGLKTGIVANNLFVFIGAGMMGIARSCDNYHLLIAGRFFLGMNAGLGAGLTPMYLTEISPMIWRGTIGSLFQLFLTISILLAQIFGLDFLLGNKDDWPFLFWIPAIIALCQLVLLPFCANSPRYLYAIGKEEKAKKALLWFRGTESVDTEFSQIQKEVDDEKSVGVVSYWAVVSTSDYRKPLIIGSMLMIGQQLSGINAIIFYSTSTFKMANLGSFAQVGTLCIGAVNVLMTIVSVMIVDKTGRRPLLIFGFAALAVDTLLFCFCFQVALQKVMWASYLCILFVLLFIIFFATGLGSIPWFIISEISTQNTRPKIVSIAVSVHWVANFFVGLLFPTFQKLMGPYVFIIFVVLQILFLIYMIVAIPETKNKSFEEIQAEFKKE